MGAQDRTENVLREIHILFSKAEPFNGSKKKVVVDKSEMMDLLKELNNCMYDMQEEYELTVASRDKADRQSRKKGDDIIFEAQKNADDIYAASIMYTDQVLQGIQKVIQEATDKSFVLMENLKKDLTEAKSDVRHNQSELKAQLQDLIDTQKYMRLIEDENLRLAKEEERKAAKGELMFEKEPPKYSDVKPEIKINEAYFRSQGIPLDDDSKEQSNSNTESDMEQALAGISSEDLDREYFGWKEDSESGNDEKNGVVEGLKDQFKGILGKLKD